MPKKKKKKKKKCIIERQTIKSRKFSKSKKPSNFPSDK